MLFYPEEIIKVSVFTDRDTLIKQYGLSIWDGDVIQVSPTAEEQARRVSSPNDAVGVDGGQLVNELVFFIV